MQENVQNKENGANPEIHPDLMKLPSALTIDIDTVYGPLAKNENDQRVNTRPWEQEGADMSDYFNYGFDEETFKIYQARARDSYMELDKAKLTKELYASEFAIQSDMINFILPHECGGAGKALNQENYHIEEDDVPVLCKFHNSEVAPGNQNVSPDQVKDGYYIKQLRGNHKSTLMENLPEGEGDEESRQQQMAMMQEMQKLMADPNFYQQQYMQMAAMFGNQDMEQNMSNQGHEEYNRGDRRRNRRGNGGDNRRNWNGRRGDRSPPRVSPNRRRDDRGGRDYRDQRDHQRDNRRRSDRYDNEEDKHDRKDYRRDDRRYDDRRKDRYRDSNRRESGGRRSNSDRHDSDRHDSGRRDSDRYDSNRRESGRSRNYKQPRDRKRNEKRDRKDHGSRSGSRDDYRGSRR